MKKRNFLIFFLFFLSIFSVSAQPQSFFIAPGQTIKNRGIAKGYCLEYSKEVLKKNNLNELTRITGNVWVIYNDGSRAFTPLIALKNAKDISINALDSYKELQFIFNDKNITEIIIGDEGITFFREYMDDYENELTRENIKKINELLVQNLPQSINQNILWKNYFPLTEIIDNVLTIDFRTTDDPDKKVQTYFDGTSTISFTKQGNPFLRVDGLLNSTEIFNNDIFEFLTHFHGDHISIAVLRRLIKNADFQRILAPYPALDESRNSTFNFFNAVQNNKNYNFKKTNNIQEITGVNMSASKLINHKTGDFDYALLRYNKDVKIEMYKYNKPKNANTDGIIYLISNKIVSFLVFGDFDDPEGIENLIDISLTNNENRKILLEYAQKISDEMREIVELNNSIKLVGILKEEFISQKVEEKTKHTERYYSLYSELNEINRLLEAMPVIKADVIKMPHHAHVFEDKYRDLIIKMNDVFNPSYMIYQPHQTQDIEKYKNFINGFKFNYKFLNSAEKRIMFYSLLELINAWRRT